jgi:hypothetical protein
MRSVLWAFLETGDLHSGLGQVERVMSKASTEAAPPRARKELKDGNLVNDSESSHNSKIVDNVNKKNEPAPVKSTKTEKASGTEDSRPGLRCNQSGQREPWSPRCRDPSTFVCCLPLVHVRAGSVPNIRD